MTFKKRTKRIYRLQVGKDGPLGHFAQLRQIHHVAHLGPAQRILARGRIRARQVNDDSRLDTHELSVCWLAPNQWERSLFGTVRFSFDFDDVIRGRRIYWVEGVEGRGPDTCRLLIMASDCTDLPVRAYDPERTEGPLRRFGGAWFWKEGVHLELMIEGDLPLTECRRVSTVLHRRDRCGARCGEVGRSASETAARLLSGLMRGRYDLPAGSFVDHGLASALVHDGWFGLLEALDLLDGDVPGKIRGKRRVDKAVRRALAHLAKGDAATAAGKVARVAGVDRVRSSLRRLLQRGTGLKLGRPDDTVIGLAPRQAASVVGRSRASVRPARSARCRPGEGVAGRKRRGDVR